MGVHGSATCVMNFDGASGWVIGGENEGLAAMFIMMNAARLSCGNQGLARPNWPIRTPPPTRSTGGRAGPPAARPLPTR
jgi:hypothetical protein